MSSLIKLAAILAIVVTVGVLHTAVPVLPSQATSNEHTAQLSEYDPSSAPSVYSSDYQDVEQGSLFFVNEQDDENHSYMLSPTIMTDVTVNVTGIVARTTVKQTFSNSSPNWVSGIYAFPLPENAAVDHLLMKVGERVIQGQIHPKEQARNIFEQGKRSGKKASLLEQQRANLFSTSIANIGPGESIGVTIEYQQLVDYADGHFNLRFPMTISPRYMPSKPVQVNFNENGWGQAPHNLAEDELPLAAYKPAAMQDVIDNNRLTLTVKLNAGLPLDSITSEFHKINTVEIRPDAYEIKLEQAAIANRDFVLNWQPARNNQPIAAHFGQIHENEQYGLILLMPPIQDNTKALPREIIFVLDTSGSMEGESIVQAKQALNMAISQMLDTDSFNIIEFNSQARQLWPEAMISNSANKDKAINFVGSLNAEGGTEMASALQLALTYSNDKETGENTLRQVVFITDGSVGNEESLMRLIQQNLGDSRLFTIGIGSAPNSYFMTEAALMGKGTFTHIGASSQVKSKMQTLLDKLSVPAMQDITASFDDFIEFYPKTIPDLYKNEPIVITYRAPQSVADNSSENSGNFLVSGRQHNTNWSHNLDMSHLAAESGLNVLWAREKIAELSRNKRKSVDNQSKEKIIQQITDTALTHHLVSQYTSLVAVDVTPSRPLSASHAEKPIVSHLPKGWSAKNKVGQLPKTATSAALNIILGLLLIGFVVCMYLQTKFQLAR
jgi:Ca-activated chloride channel family protein